MQSPLQGEHLNQPFSTWPFPKGRWPIWPLQLAATKDLPRIQSNGAAKAPAALPRSSRVSCKVISLRSLSPFRHRLSSRAKIAASEAGECCDIIPRFSQQTPLQTAGPACSLETKAKVLVDDFGGPGPRPAPRLQSWALSVNRNPPNLAFYLGEEKCTQQCSVAHLHLPRAKHHRLAGACSLPGPGAHRLGWTH